MIWLSKSDKVAAQNSWPEGLNFVTGGGAFTLLLSTKYTDVLQHDRGSSTPAVLNVY